MKTRILTLEGIGKLPATEFGLLPNSTIEFRYLLNDGEYPGFDEQWREMSQSEQCEHLRLGGRIAEWLKLMEKRGSMR